MTNKKQTLAEFFAVAFGDDGQVFENASGQSIEETLKHLEIGFERGEGENHSCTRYEFQDGSAIIVSGDAWDVEGKTPWSFNENEPNN